MRRVRVVGVGMGPQHLTRQADRALREADFVLAARKGPDDALLEVRRQICAEYDLDLVEVEDPPRDRADPVDYPRAVREWHRARVSAYGQALACRSGTAALLVWGDPSLYDSTIRVVGALAEQMALDWDVIPGISAPQLLAARHRVVLHDIGHPVHVTTARRLPQAVAAGQRTIVVMLGSLASLTEVVGDPDLASWRIWWGANLDTDGEQLLAGRVGEVGAGLLAAHRAAHQRSGWVMDAYLLRADQEPV